MKLSFNLLILCALLAFGAQAHALSITPTTGVLNNDADFLNESRWEGTSGPGMPAIEADIRNIMLAYNTAPVLPELYKRDYGTPPPPDVGALANSYETSFPNDASATITYIGGGYVGPEAFILVKDGNHRPIWYLFDLTQLGWNGTETLNLSGFWAGVPGSISHVSLYGSTVQPVPEPATMLLLGTGLIGLAGLGRKKLKMA